MHWAASCVALGLHCSLCSCSTSEKTAISTGISYDSHGPDSQSGILQVPVFCNGLHGVYLLGRQRIVCSCPDCMAKPEAKREHSCTQFEMHCGAGAAKKWKASLRVEPGGVPEVPAGAASTLQGLHAAFQAPLWVPAPRWQPGCSHREAVFSSINFLCFVFYTVQR